MGEPPPGVTCLRHFLVLGGLEVIAWFKRSEMDQMDIQCSQDNFNGVVMIWKYQNGIIFFCIRDAILAKCKGPDVLVV